MTPEIVTRSFSNDQYVFDNVFFNNVYKIKGEKDSTKVFLDIGAHAGYFAFSALTLGARKVYALEPFVDSFKILLQNCYNPNFIGKFTPYQVGVYTEKRIGKFSIPKLMDGVYFDINSVGLCINDEEDYYPCYCVTLDEILENYCYKEKIDVLKINIGYAEKEILLGSKFLYENVDAVCGEISLNEEEFLKFKTSVADKGFINCFSSPEKDGRIKFWISKVDLNENFVF